MPGFGMEWVGLIIGFLFLLAIILGITYGARALGRYSSGRKDLSQSSPYSALGESTVINAHLLYLITVINHWRKFAGYEFGG
ncbi:MAG: hypothetical protein GTO14_12910 [Anaerolineales bacterium]|nr:hypothetical protein [Anaerolineales bacterium]